MPKRIVINFMRDERLQVLVQPKAGQPRGDVQHDATSLSENVSRWSWDGQQHSAIHDLWLCRSFTSIVNSYLARLGGAVWDAGRSAGSDGWSDRITIRRGRGSRRIDSRLLFSGAYSRDGSDLLISDGAASIRLPSYFSTDAPQALVSTAGAILRGETVELLAGPRAPGQYAQAGGSAGRVRPARWARFSGSATVQHADGTTEQLGADSQIFQGDVIRTGADGTVGILFKDNTVLLLEPSSRIVVNEFVYDPNGQSNSAVLDAIDGSFAFVAGKIAKTGGLDINTPIATMGIRGTTGLCAALDSGGARCSLAPDPNFEIGRIEVIDRATGALFATLTETGVKIVLRSGQLSVVDKSDQEIVFDELLVQQLHQLYSDLGVPRSGPLQKTENQNGDDDFRLPVEIGRLALLPDTPMNVPSELLPREFTTTSLGDLIVGSTTIGNLDEEGLGMGMRLLTGVLQFRSEENKAVRFDFASLNGRAVLDIEGRPVTAGGVPLRFSWDTGSHILTAFASDLAVFAVTLDPDTGSYLATLLGALDHPVAGAADLLTIGLAFTITVEDGRTATGTLAVRFADDVPDLAIGHASAQMHETQATGGSWSLAPGADGVGSLVVSAGGIEKVLLLADPDNQVALDLKQGMLVVRADGTWTFAARHNLDNNIAHDIVFSLNATDGDGDPVTAIARIVVADGTAPSANGEHLALFLDEKALDAADVRPGDDIGSQLQLPSEFGAGAATFTAGSDDLIAFVLDGSKANVLDNEGHAITVTWIGSGTGELVGRVKGIDAIRIEVTHTLIQAFSTGNVFVNARLLDNFRHNADGADAIHITGLSVIAKDIDGSAASSAVTIAISDDGPSISLGGAPAEVAESGLVTGLWSLVPGADGVDEVSVSFRQQSKILELGDPNNAVTFSTPAGELRLFADGRWSFKAATNLDNSVEQSNTFTLTARDGDGDTSTAVQAITVNDGAVAATPTQ